MSRSAHVRFSFHSTFARSLFLLLLLLGFACSFAHADAPYYVNCGGPAVMTYVADTSSLHTRATAFRTFTTANTVSVNGVANAAPATCYQSQVVLLPPPPPPALPQITEYALTGFTPSQTYAIRLHFAEIDGTVTAAGQRFTNVSTSGGGGVSNLDVFNEAGGANKALVKSTFATADVNGKITIDLSPGILNVIEILPNNTYAADVPAPGWALGSIPAHAAGGGGASSANIVNLASGVYENSPPPDAVVRNPYGPSPVFARAYRSANVTQVRNGVTGYASPGLPLGWTHNYDVTLQGTAGSWSPLTLTYPNGATETLTPDTSDLTKWFVHAHGIPYATMGTASGTVGRWNNVTLLFKDLSQWTFTPSGGNPDRYLLTKISSLTGRFIQLNYDTATNHLNDIYDDAQHLLLHLDYANGILLALTEHSDPNNWRKIAYTVGPANSAPGATCLTNVSEMYPASGGVPYDSWRYDYTLINGKPYLYTVSAHDPTTATNNYLSSVIAYDGNAHVSGHVDSNGYQSVYSATAGLTNVQVKDKAANGSKLALTWQQVVGNLNLDTGFRDSFNKPARTSYDDHSNPYLPTSYTNRKGQMVSATYDDYGNVLTTTVPVHDAPGGQLVTTYAYYPGGTLPSDPVPPFGLLRSVQVGGKTPITLAYYLNNTSKTTLSGVTYIQPNGSVSSVSVPLPGAASGSGTTVSTTYIYTTLGNVAQIQTPNPNASGTPIRPWTFFYTGGTVATEALGEPVSISDPLQHVTQYAYDAHGNTRSVKDALLYETKTTYNYLDQPTSLIYPSTNGTTNSHLDFFYLYPNNATSSGSGPLRYTQLVNEVGAVERTVNVTNGKEGETTDTTGSTEIVHALYNPFYALSNLGDGNNNKTGFSYDGNGNLTQMLFPRNDGQTYGYDADDNATGLLDGNGTQFTDNLAADDNRLTSTTYKPNGQPQATTDATYTYDGYGRVQSVTDASGTYQYAYDDLDNVTSETTTYASLPALTIMYSYFPDGSRASMNVAGTNYIYGYDDAGRLIKVRPPWNNITYTYFNNDWLASQTTVLVKTTYHYNARGWLADDPISGGKGLENRNFSDNTLLSQFSNFAYDASGNLAGYSENTPLIYGIAGPVPPKNAAGLSGPVTFQYDTQDHLQQENSQRVSLTNGNSGPSDRFLANYASPSLFTSDPADNLTTVRNSARTYNTDNQLNGATYDGQGNPTGYLWYLDSTHTGNGINVFNVFDHLTNFNGIFSAGYRADGLRAWKQSGSLRTYFLYDGGRLVAEMDSTGAIVGQWAWGATGLAERHTSTQESTDYYQYSFDPLGNLVQRHGFTLNVQKGVLASYTASYDAFGAELGCTDPGTSEQSTAQDAIGWGGQWGGYTDQETASASSTSLAVRYPLVLCGLRYYDPSTGRFLTRDPMGMEGGVNLYAYTRNNPVNFADPMGLQTIPQGAVICPKCKGNGYIGGPRVYSHVPPHDPEETVTAVEYSLLWDYCDYCNCVGYVPAKGWKGKSKFMPKSTEAAANRLSTVLRDNINQLGAAFGCASCGAKTPGQPNWTPDHIAPASIPWLLPGAYLFSFQPHCRTCRQNQSVKVRAFVQLVKRTALAWEAHQPIPIDPLPDSAHSQDFRQVVQEMMNIGWFQSIGQGTYRRVH